MDTSKEWVTVPVIDGAATLPWNADWDSILLYFLYNGLRIETHLGMGWAPEDWTREGDTIKLDLVECTAPRFKLIEVAVAVRPFTQPRQRALSA